MYVPSLPSAGNGDYSTTETQISGLYTSISNIQAQILSMGGVSSISSIYSQNNLPTINTEIATLSGWISTISGSVYLNTTDVNLLSGQIQTISGSIQTISSTVNTNTININSLSGEIATLTGGVQQMPYSCSLYGFVERQESIYPSTSIIYQEPTGFSVSRDTATINWNSSQPRIISKADFLMPTSSLVKINTNNSISCHILFNYTGNEIFGFLNKVDYYKSSNDEVYNSLVGLISATPSGATVRGWNYAFGYDISATNYHTISNYFIMKGTISEYIPLGGTGNYYSGVSSGNFTNVVKYMSHSYSGNQGTVTLYGASQNVLWTVSDVIDSSLNGVDLYPFFYSASGTFTIITDSISFTNLTPELNMFSPFYHF